MTTTQTRTPGPWKHRATAYIDYIEGVGGALIFTGEIGTANARLIAAAPELLAALKGLVGEINNLVEESTLPDGAYVHPSMVAAKNAIAKAEGR